MNNHRVESSLRLDVFKAKQAAQRNINASGHQLTSEEQRLVDRMIRDGSRAGLALPEEQRAELVRLKRELSNASTEFTVRMLCQATLLILIGLSGYRRI